MPKRVSKVLDQFGRPIVLDVGRSKLSSRYDAAQTTDENRRHWQEADGLSARAANNPGVRRTLRNRERYERQNDPYYGGMVRTIVGDLFGTGATLQSQIADNDNLNTRIEQAFAEHVDAIGLLQKLLTAGESKIGSEAIGLLRSVDSFEGGDVILNRKTVVPLDIQFLESEQCATPPGAIPNDPSLWVDGIELDKYGRPTVYHILRQHPGDSFVMPTDYERVPANLVLHWFRRAREGQYRGIPECTASLPIGAQRRRWSMATLTAAECAADFAVLITSELPQGFNDDDLPSEWETMDLNRGMITTLPAGGDAKQMRSEHPNQEHGPFKHELIKEMGRPVGSPYSVSGLDASEHNYSSLRYEREIYYSALRVERRLCEWFVLSPFFRAWYAMARLIPGYLADEIRTLPEQLPFGWYWPGFSSLDPMKEAMADTEALSNGTKTLQELHAEKGQDWRVKLLQRSREIKFMQDNKIPLPAWADPAAAKAPKPMANDPQPNEDAQTPAALRLAVMA